MVVFFLARLTSKTAAIPADFIIAREIASSATLYLGSIVKSALKSF